MICGDGEREGTVVRYGHGHDCPERSDKHRLQDVGWGLTGLDVELRRPDALPPSAFDRRLVAARVLPEGHAPVFICAQQA